MRAAIQFASVAILARLITQDDFGLVTMSLAIVGIATVLGDFGLSMASIQSQTINQMQRSNLFWTNALVGLVLFAVTLAAAPLIAAFYGRSELTLITGALAVTFLLNALAAQFRAEVSRQLRFRWLAAADVGSAFLGLVAAVILAIGGAGYWALVAQQIAVALVSLVVVILGAQWLPGLPRRGQDMRSFYVFGANTLGVQLLNYVTANFDSIIIGRVWGAAPLGIYDRAFRLFRLPLQQIASPMTKVAMPVLSRLQDDSVRYEAYLLRAQTLLGYCFGGAFLLLAAVSDPLISLLLGPGWEEAKPIFAILAIGGVFQGLGYVYYWVFLSRALTGLQLRWSLITRSFTLLLMVLGVIWGPVGVATAATAGLALNWIVLSVFPMKKTGVARSPLIIAALRPVAFLAPMAAILFVLSYRVLTDLSPWLELPVLLACAVTYVAAGCLIPAIRADYAAVWGVLRHLRR